VVFQLICFSSFLPLTYKTVCVYPTLIGNVKPPLKCRSTSNVALCVKLLQMNSYSNLKDKLWYIQKYEEPNDLLDLVKRDVGEWSGALVWWLYGTIIQCIQYSFSLLLHQYHWIAFPPLSFHVYIQTFVSCTKYLDTNYQ
jgi:hypothetical protein